MNSPPLDGMSAYIYKAILRFAGGKRYVMRSPVRMWFYLWWEDKHEGDIPVTEAQKKKCKVKFGLALQNLEERGYIRRIGPGCIEVLENR